jgi:hypothetical protein
MKTAIVLGAGASAAEGAPLQKDIFKEFFKSVKGPASVGNRMVNDLSSFFQLIFGINVESTDLNDIQFPTFEETLGVLDLAERRHESIKGFDLDNIPRRFSYLRVIRQHLVLLMAKVIHDKLESSRGHHKRLVENLAKVNILKDTVFISTNYDILIDNALVGLFPQYSLDYGIDFTNFDDSNDWKRPSRQPVRLYKIHGSLNWLYCPTCNTLTLTPKEKGIIRVLSEESSCPKCDSSIVPIIVPPTYYKELSNAFLSMVWHQAEQSLRIVDHVIFCGYSFPDADMHVKYLLKRIQTNRPTRLSFTVVNNHRGKQAREMEQEKGRFVRFLGSEVEYSKGSFEEFARNPLNYMPSANQHAHFSL